MRQLIEPADPLEWRRSGTVTPRCTSDACCQGRAPCPTPQACALPDEDDFGAFRGLLSWPCVSCAAIVCAALVAVFWPH